MSETNFFLTIFFSDKKIFFSDLFLGLNFVSYWILSRTEFCLGLHTAVIFSMQSFDISAFVDKEAVKKHYLVCSPLFPKYDSINAFMISIYRKSESQKTDHVKVSSKDKTTNQNNKERTTSINCDKETNLSDTQSRTPPNSETEALHTLASVAVERGNDSNITQTSPTQHLVIENSAVLQNQPCKVIIVNASQSSAMGAVHQGVPILPKPHTLLLPVEYDIQDGNRFVIKTGPTVGICDPRPRAPRSLNNNVLKPIKPKLPVNDVKVNVVRPMKDPPLVTSAQTDSGIREVTEEEGRKETVSVGIQTDGARKSRAIAGTQTVKKTKIVMETETQTSGDYILRKAMKSANILTDNKSCGTHFFPHVQQRSYKSAPNSTQTVEEIPKKSLKRRSRNKSMHNSTQTIGEPPLKKHKPRKTKTVAWQTEPEEIPLPSDQMVQSIETIHTGELLGPVLSVREVNPNQTAQTPQVQTQSEQSQLGTSINTDALQLSSIETQTLQSLTLSHNTTQTQTLWDELEKTLAESISTQTFHDPLGESISTQTFDSFLATNNNTSTDRDSFSATNRTVLDRGASMIDQSHNSSFNDPPHNVSFSEQSQNASFDSSFTQGSASRDPIIGSPVGHMTNMGHFGVQTDESPLSNFFASSSAQTSLFDDTAAFTSIETQTVDDMFEQLLLSNMHTQTADNFLDSLELTDIQTQTYATMDMNNSFESSTQTRVSLDTSHAESQTSVIMDTSSSSLDMETQTQVTMETTNYSQSGSGAQTFAPERLLSTAETQTQFQRMQSVGTNSLNSQSVGTNSKHLQTMGANSRNVQSVGTSSLVELAETETQTLLETLGMNGDPIHSQTQTSWSDVGSPYL